MTSPERIATRRARQATHVNIDESERWASLIGGSLVSSVLIALVASRNRLGREDITVRGPASYAGPGSLGGTKSAFGERR